MMRIILIISFYSLFILPVISRGQTNLIIMDGEFADWDSVSYLYGDPTGDVSTGSIDFGGIKVTNDDNYLFIYTELNKEVNLQSFLNATIYIDSDNNLATGKIINNIGAELMWNFANKSGYFYVNAGSTLVSQVDIGIITSPTVSSETFEISFELSSKPDGNNFLFPSSRINIAMIDHDNGDAAPEPGDSIEYEIKRATGVPYDMRGISKTDSDHIRFVTWNVHVDDMFVPSLLDEYTRILQAIDPDIITFQEIYSHDLTDVKNIMETILPSEMGEEWYTFSEDNDIVLASRYPIIGTWIPNSPNRAFLVKLKPEYPKNLLVIGVHTPCCANDAGRQNEIDGVMAFIRDAKTQGGDISIEADTPIIIAGDYNFVGDRRQLETMLTGDLDNNSIWGVDFAPDWDGTDLTDAISRHTNTPQTYTWRNDFSSFSPGRLDFIIYTDSAIEIKKSYVLWTGEMLQDSLEAHGLFSDDVDLASDHLPIVADFAFTDSSGTAIEDKEAQIPERFSLEQNYPNPFNSITTIEYVLPQTGGAILTVFNMLGEEVARIMDREQSAGYHQVTWDASNIASGIYFYRLQTADFVLTRKMVLLK